MRIGIIIGSHRHSSQSSRVGAYIASRFADAKINVQTDIFDLAGNPYPLWDEGVWQNKEPWATIWQPVAKRLQSCDGFVVIAPEWAGMVPPGLKNFMLLCGTSEVAHKAALIVGVSASRNGAYPIDELRHSSYKNNRICYIPEHIIVRNAASVFDTPVAVPGSDDEYLRLRVDYACKMLCEYAKALGQVRASGAIDHKSFPTGM